MKDSKKKEEEEEEVGQVIRGLHRVEEFLDWDF